MNVETQQNIMLNCAHIEVQSAQVYCGMFAEAEVIPKGTINSGTTGCVDKALLRCLCIFHAEVKCVFCRVQMGR